MKSYRQLQEERAEVGKALQGLIEQFEANDKKWVDSEAEAKFKDLGKTYTDLTSTMEAAEKADEVAAISAQIQEHDNHVRAFADRIAPTPHTKQFQGRSIQELQELAFQGWAIAAARPEWLNTKLGQEARAAAEYCGMPIGSSELNLGGFSTRKMKQVVNQMRAVRPEQQNQIFNAALVSTAGSNAAGNAIPPGTMAEAIEIAMLSYGSMLREADTIVTQDGTPFQWPVANDTGNSGRLIAESAAHDDNAGGGSSGDGGPNPNINKIEWNAYEYTSDTILAPNRLVEDFVGNLEAIMSEMCGIRLGRALNAAFTTADGSGKPNGIVTAAALGHTAGSATSLVDTDFYALKHSVDPDYRRNAIFMMDDDTYLKALLLRDGDGRPLFNMGMVTGTPDTLLGHRIAINQDVATVAASAKVALFGDVTRYKIRRVRDITVRILRERYAEKNQIGIVAFVRADGDLLNAGVAPVKYLAMAAS